MIKVQVLAQNLVLGKPIAVALAVKLHLFFPRHVFSFVGQVRLPVFRALITPLFLFLQDGRIFVALADGRIDLVRLFGIVRCVRVVVSVSSRVFVLPEGQAFKRSGVGSCLGEALKVGGTAFVWLLLHGIQRP